MNVKLVKLVNGEFFIAEVIEGELTLVLKNSFYVHIHPTQDGSQIQMGMSNVNGYFGNDEELVISKNHVLYSFPASDPVQKQYVQNRSGITIANSVPSLDLSELMN